MGSVFFEGMAKFLTKARAANDTSPVCESAINHYSFYQLTLIPAILLTILMAATKSRRNKLLSVLNGRPGLVFPMDTMTRSSRISYCCAFGATAFLVYEILLSQKFAVDYHGPISLKSLIAVLSMFIYGLVFFPVFTSLALGTAFSYALGSVYIWVFFTVEVYRVNECDFTAQGKAVLLVRALPSLLCLGYLSLSLPFRFCMACYKRKFFTASQGEDPYRETIQEIKDSYQGKHVRKLLRKPEPPPPPPEGFSAKVKHHLKAFTSRWIYHRQSGFRYPSRLMSVLFIGGCVVYVITVEIMVVAVSILDTVLTVLGDEIEIVGLEEEPGESEETTAYRNGLLFGYYVAHTSKISMIVSISLAILICILSIIHMMSSFRANLYALYRGDYRIIPPPAEQNAVALCVASIKYAGFQVAYLVWAYIISVIIIFIICMLLATFISLLMFGITDWLVDYILQLWPSLLIAIALVIIQKLLATYIFLQDRGQHLRLDNRRFFFIFTYFMFFYNIFLGFFSCLLRIIKAMIIGTLFLARLDNSTLPRRFEFFDPGFSAYKGYIHMENAHTHPVVLVFLRLLVSMSQSRKKQDNGNVYIPMETFKTVDSAEDNADTPKARPVNIAARFNWQVTYTLLLNPSVRIYRKGFIQALRKAQKEGLKVPISDRPCTNLDLIKTAEEREQEREKELLEFRKENQSLVGALATGRESDQNNGKQSEEKPKKKTWFGFKKQKNASSKYEEDKAVHRPQYHLLTDDYSKPESRTGIHHPGSLDDQDKREESSATHETNGDFTVNL